MTAARRSFVPFYTPHHTNTTRQTEDHPAAFDRFAYSVRHLALYRLQLETVVSVSYSFFYSVT